MTKEMLSLLQGEVMDEELELTLAELSAACRLPAEHLLEMVEYGLIEPLGGEPSRWRFSGISVQRVRCAQRLRRDLGVNLAGAALALDLLEEIDRLRARLRRLEGE